MTTPTRGRPSPRFGQLGVWLLSLGPNSPVPGTRLEIVILDAQGGVVRKLEQIRGSCTDPGWVDFWNSPRCRPAQHEYPIVDLLPDGTVQDILHPNFEQRMGPALFFEIVGDWARKYGRPEYNLLGAQ